MVQLNDLELQVDEIIIKVPWGHIAGKWWGSKSCRPIILIHGWQDNAGSFDPLVVELPKHISYLAIDLPGHGLSSRIPDGMMYSIEIHYLALLLVLEHFKWDKVSLMSHSLGSVVAFYFAANFPDKCDLLIGLDGLKPININYDVLNRYFSFGVLQAIKADIRNRDDSEPPSYTFDELLDKVKAGVFMEISRESAPYLLKRAVKPSQLYPNKFYFTRDDRLRASTVPMQSHEATVKFAKNITSPYCFIEASESAAMLQAFEDPKYYDEIMEIMHENPNFEKHRVIGGHHVHLNESNKVSGIISSFINKYRPPNVLSKL
ncbi:hypothetical protein HA402_009447 [Bradysia odoriphaga]|nr:hypothetical protein HA402_009447 [Bradysia odoriphaga]